MNKQAEKMPRNQQNEYADIHSALMPIKLADYIIKTFINENDIVLDCFSGLGTTLMSCIKNNRTYQGIELEPLYCQKTIERYRKFITHKFNVKIIRNGEIIDSEKVQELCSFDDLSLFDF